MRSMIDGYWSVSQRNIFGIPATTVSGSCRGATPTRRVGLMKPPQEAPMRARTMARIVWLVLLRGPGSSSNRKRAAKQTFKSGGLPPLGDAMGRRGLWAVVVLVVSSPSRGEGEAVLSIPVVGGSADALVLYERSDPCDAIRSFCRGAADCVWQMVGHVQPLLHADWPRWRGVLEVGDSYLAGCAANVSFGPAGGGRERASERSADLLGLLEAAIASRDPASPFLARYNREKALLAPEDHVAHYRAVALLLPRNSAALDHLANALKAADHVRDADLVLRRGVDVLGLWPSRMQRPSAHVPGLEARAVWAPAAFPAVAALVDARSRLLAVLGAELLPELARHRDASLVAPQAEGLVAPLAAPSRKNDATTAATTAAAAAAAWTEVVLFKHHVVPAAVRRRFPSTLAAIQDAEARAGFERGAHFFNAKVSILHPGTRILPHCGPSNARLRAHVTLSHGGGASIRVGDERPLSWVEGAALVIDDSFEHEVTHAGDAPRVVLILDFWHPDLPDDARVFERYGVS